MDPFNEAKLTSRTHVEKFGQVFGFLRDILVEPKFMKIGSGIHQNIDLFWKFFPGLTNADVQHVLDSAPLVKRMRCQGVTRPMGMTKWARRLEFRFFRTSMPDLITDATALKPRGEPGRTYKGAWTKGALGTCPMFLWINKHLIVPGPGRSTVQRRASHLTCPT